MSLTKEELEELHALEEEEKTRKSEEADAVKRQHLEALKMAKRLAPKYGTPGRDFVVLETKVGNFAVRAPKDVEIDSMDENGGRAEDEKIALSLVVEPADPIQVQKLMAENPGLAFALGKHAFDLLKILREENAKK